MKKIRQTSIILFLVAIAFFVKAYISQNSTLALIGMFILVICISKEVLIKRYGNIDYNDDIVSDDFVLRYLKADPILYADMISVYKQGNCDLLYEENDGILIYDHTSKYYLGSAKTLAGARDIVFKLPQDYNVFVAHEDIFESLLNKDFRMSEKLLSYNWVYEKRAKYNFRLEGIECRMLDESYIPIIKEHYTIKDLCTDEYISSRIKAGMLGAFINDEIVGFIGIHDIGALGMLEVFPAFTGRKIATLLECLYINSLLDKKYQGIIYSQVIYDNMASIKIQKRLGFTQSKQVCHWYFS